MNLTIKTLKGAKFTVAAEASNTVSEVKSIIEASKAEFPAASLKLIHAGKVLKDDDTIESCNIKPNDFLVCMVSKAKRKPTAAPTPAPSSNPSTTSASATATETSRSTSSSAETTPATPANTSTVTSTTNTAPPPSSASNNTTTTSTPATTSSEEFSTEVISNLTSMGFPEAEARACLRAAQGNPDIAVEFLMNGIPPAITAPASQSTTNTPAAPGEPLTALRNHPQFDALRRLVQSNPQALQAVLSQIGEQQPSLLQEINANQSIFLQMMNEPVSDTPTVSAPTNTSTTTTTSSSGSGSGSRLGNMLGGGANPAQMAQMLSSMNPNELNEMASMMGLTPEQLRATAQMIGQMPPEQFQDFVSQALQQENGMGGMGLGSGMPGHHVLSLSEEEMAAVDRLTEMGFDRSEAAQAFLACDKNEALAANLLMDSAGDFGMGDGGASNNGGNADDSDDMYN